MREYILAFIPIFVAVDAIGVLPLFINLTEKYDKPGRNRIVRTSIITALLIGISFIFIGQGIFRLLNITSFDFMIAGGILLFILAINNLLNPEKRRRIPAEALGVVPLGTPLIVGPAVLAMILILVDAYKLLPTIVSLISNVLIAGFIFSSSEILVKIVGISGFKAISRIASLLLAAIGVMMVRKGISGILL